MKEALKMLRSFVSVTAGTYPYTNFTARAVYGLEKIYCLQLYCHVLQYSMSPSFHNAAATTTLLLLVILFMCNPEARSKNSAFKYS
jgi:hypothetical protein